MRLYTQEYNIQSYVMWRALLSVQRLKWALMVKKAIIILV